MKSKRRFWKVKFTIEVLTEDKEIADDLPSASLESIQYQITEGHCSGRIKHSGTVEMGSRRMANELLKQGSDPGFFQIDEDGNELSDGDA